jgi:hypothetical protein
MKQPMEYFKKIFIKSEADLPKENGTYYTYAKAKAIGMRGFDNSKDTIAIWMSYVDWYFQPCTIREVTDEEIDKKIFQLCSEMRPWDGKSSPKTTPELLKEFAKWAKKHMNHNEINKSNAI